MEQKLARVLLADGTDSACTLTITYGAPSLRRVALGRSNYLFFGKEEAGKNFAALYTLVASCEQHGVNAIAYLADVLTRVQTHPAAQIADLLPHR